VAAMAASLAIETAREAPPKLAALPFRDGVHCKLRLDTAKRVCDRDPASDRPALDLERSDLPVPGRRFSFSASDMALALASEGTEEGLAALSQS